MKETIYTIPINDAYDLYCGCPICRLEHDLETSSIEYIMGPAMMEPDTRIETNKVGFCAKHYDMMLNVKKRLSLALMLESHLEEIHKEILPENTKALNKKDLEAIAGKLINVADNCFVCNQINSRMEKYYNNIIYLWSTSEEFREKTAKQESFCLHHLAHLFNAAKKELNKRDIPRFVNDHITASRKKALEYNEGVSEFCKSFDHRFANTPLSDRARSSVENAISFLTNS